MTDRKLALFGAALVGAMISLSAGAQDRNASGYPDSGDRGVVTPANVPDASGPNQERGVGGTSTMPSLNVPASVPDQQTDRVGRAHQSPLVSDSKLLPSPITPGNVSDSNMSASRYDRTNDGGMGYRGMGWTQWGYGGTR